jgi:SAM-dependent methyltransferase
MSLPEHVPCSWSGETLYLRYAVAKIWTQALGRPFGIYWSNKLSFGRLWPDPSNEELASFYAFDSYSDYLSGKCQTQIEPIIAEKLVTRFAWMADRSDEPPFEAIQRLRPIPQSVCDVGCGSGDFLKKLRAQGWITTGIDPSPISSTALAKREIEFYPGTAEHLPRLDRKFDVVTMFQSLEHCRQPLLAVQNLRSILNRGGIVAIDVPNMACWGFEKYGAAWWHADAGRHLQFFTQKSLDALLRAAGLTAFQWHYSGFVGQFSKKWATDMQEVWHGIGSSSQKPTWLKSIFHMPMAMASLRSKKYETLRVYAKAD